MIHPNIFMFDEGSGDILNHRGARAHRDTDQGRDVYLCFDSAVCDMRARTVGTRDSVPRRPGSLVTRSLSRQDIRLAHSSCPPLIKIFSQSPALSFMFPMAIAVQNFIIETFLIKVGALVIISRLS